MIKLLTILFLILLQSCVKKNNAPIHNKDEVASIAQNSTIDTSRIGIVVIGGQSNPEGGAWTTMLDSQYIYAMPGALIFYKPTNTSANDGSIQTLDLGKNNNFRWATACVGPELGIGWFVTHAGKKVGIIKYAYGGSQLVDHGTHFNGFWEVNQTHSIPQYKILVNDFVKPGLDSFRAKGYNPYIAAFVWCQGEADSNDSTAAWLYQKKLTELITQFKKDLKPYADSMKIIIVRTRTWKFKYADVVRRAQVYVALSMRGYWLNSDTWPLAADGLHYTKNANTTIFGKAVADILIPGLP